MPAAEIYFNTHQTNCDAIICSYNDVETVEPYTPDCCLQGDSGSGLIVVAATGPVVVGVVSYGWDCGDNRAPGVYAR